MSNKNLAVHFSQKTDEWSTPQWLFDILNSKYGPFELDAAATADNTKCEWFITQEDNALEMSWKDYKKAYSGFQGDINRVWLNPAYSNLGEWLKKAYNESQKGCTVVCLVPSRTDTKAWHEYAMKASEVLFIKGRLKFGDAKNSAPFPSAVVVFRPGSNTPSFQSFEQVK